MCLTGYVLHSGKTVIQHIYDSHYEGADRARDFISQWKGVEGHIDEERYRDILARLRIPGRRSRRMARRNLQVDLSAVGHSRMKRAEMASFTHASDRSEADPVNEI